MKNAKQTFRFNSKSAKGIITVQRGVFGLEIKVNGKPFAMIDLYPQIKSPAEPANLILLEENGDPLMTIMPVSLAETAVRPEKPFSERKNLGACNMPQIVVEYADNE